MSEEPTTLAEALKRIHALEQEVSDVRRALSTVRSASVALIGSMHARATYEQDSMASAAKAYENHRIKIERPCGTRWSLLEQKPDGRWSGNLWCEIIVLAGGSVLVHGDFEPCIFAGFSGGSPRDHIAWIGGHEDVSYPASKASLGLGSREYVEEIDEDVLRTELREIADDWENESGEKIPEEVLEAIDDACDQIETEALQQFELQKLIMQLVEANVVDSERAASLGVVTSRRAIMAHAAIRRLHILLCERERAAEGAK